MSSTSMLVPSLLREKLVDELSLLVHPVAVGTGCRLFDDINDPMPLRLMESNALGTGLRGP